MTKAFTLTISVKNPLNSLRLIHHESIESDSLTELCAKIPFVIVKVQEKLQEEYDRHKIIINDDDIPF